MIDETVIVESVEKLTHKIYLLKTYAPKTASQIKPSQFCNIKISETDYPLLRRPFSVCDVEGDFIYFMFDVHGLGTDMLANRKRGDEMSILAPLGNGFFYENKNFDTAVRAAGGLGLAPFPYLTKELEGKAETLSFIGGRNKDYVSEYGLTNVHTATDDGSLGFKGTVVDLLEEKKELFLNKNPLIFTCGPTPMLRAVKEFSEKYKLECQVSTEQAMACGFGICQGCPIESTIHEDKYLLVCKDGPVFNAKDVVL